MRFVLENFLILWVLKKLWTHLRGNYKQPSTLQPGQPVPVEPLTSPASFRRALQKAVQEKEAAQSRIAHLEELLHTKARELHETREAYKNREADVRHAEMLLNDPDVQSLLQTKRPYIMLGLCYRRRNEVAPVLAIAELPGVHSVLPERARSVAGTVQVIVEALMERTDLLNDFFNMPVLGMHGNVDLYSGHSCTSNDHTKARSVALALTATRDTGVRNELRQELIPAYTNATDWSFLNRKLFKSHAWKQAGHQKKDDIDDVLINVMGKEAVGGFFKVERVAAALMLGLLMKEGLIV